MILATFITETLLSALVAWLLGRHWHDWSKGRVALLSALPIPLVIWGICAFIFVSASTASAEECGVDACGMAIASAMFVAMGTIVIYLLGVIVAFFVAHKVPRPAESNLADIFE